MESQRENLIRSHDILAKRFEEEELRTLCFHLGALPEDGILQEATEPTPQLAARALNDLRQRIGPIGVPIHELIDEERRR